MKLWKEKYDPLKHQNKMWGPGCEIPDYGKSNLETYSVYFVRVCSFTFEFHSLQQISSCLRYYSDKIHPRSTISSKLLETGVYGGDHEETQRWYERLPMELLENSKRIKVVSALKKALDEFS